MGNKLLVRSYDVGVGDCIYVRIPNGDDDFHILIDCGTIGKVELLKKALKDIEENLLPSVGNNGKKRLDLVVATHRHRDHIKGFDQSSSRTYRLIIFGSVPPWTRTTSKPKRHKHFIILRLMQ